MGFFHKKNIFFIKAKISKKKNILIKAKIFHKKIYMNFSLNKLKIYQF